jgi:hypothetical protein
MPKLEETKREPRKQATDAEETQWTPGRVPPPNARTIKPSYKTGTISRAAARAAVEAVMAAHREANE